MVVTFIGVNPFGTDWRGAGSGEALAHWPVFVQVEILDEFHLQSPCFSHHRNKKNSALGIIECDEFLFAATSTTEIVWLVFLVGLEEGFLPHTRSIAEGTKDEERRLLYVGITRAKDQLTMTYCSTRIKWGQETGCQPSSFIGELDDEFLLHTTYDEIQGATPSTDELESFFGNLRGLLEET